MKLSIMIVALIYCAHYGAEASSSYLRVGSIDEEGESQMCFPTKVRDLDTMGDEIEDVLDSVELPDSYYADPCAESECGELCFLSKENPEAFGFCDASGSCREVTDPASLENKEAQEQYAAELTCPAPDQEERFLGFGVVCAKCVSCLKLGKAAIVCLPLCFGICASLL